MNTDHSSADGTTLYYLRFIAPFESTNDAFIEGQVIQVALQVAGRVARVLVNDNQFVNAGEVLVQIEPSDYEARLLQERADLASAHSRLAQASAQLTVDQAKAEQERANVLAAQAEATRAEADSKRYEAIGTSGVSQSQMRLAQLPKVKGDPDPRRANDACETNSSSNQARHPDSVLIAALILVVFAWSALVFCMYVIWAKCRGSSPF